MNHTPPHADKRSDDKVDLTAGELICYQLRATGYSIAQVSQQMGISESTVKRYDREVKSRIGSLPSIQIAKDHIQSLLPKCVQILTEALKGTDLRLATEQAHRIMNSLGALQEKRSVVLIDDTNATDDELISEAQRIIAGVGVGRE